MSKRRIVEAVLKFKDDFTKGMDGAAKKFQANQKMMQRTGRQIWKTGKSIERTGQTMTKAITAPVVGIGVASSKMYSDFEQSMAKVGTIADGTEMPLKKIESQVLKLSDSTGVAASDIANSVYDAISAGQSTSQAVKAVGIAVRLGKAGFTETGKAMDILTTITNSYGKAAGSLTNISDRLLTVQNKGKVTVDELASSMGGVIPIAKSNNVGINDLSASYITLTKNGVKADKATTWLKSTYNELGNSSSGVAKVLKNETGKSFSDLLKSGKSVGDVLTILKGYADKTGTSFSDLWSNANAKSGANSILLNLKDYTQGLNDVSKSAGATKTALGILGQTDQAKLTKGINRLKNDMIKLGATVLPVVMPYIEKGLKYIDKMAKKFDSLDQSTKNNIVKFALIAAAIGPVLVGTGKLTQGLGNGIQLFAQAPGKMKEFAGMLKGFPGLFGAVGSGFSAIPGMIAPIVSAAAPILAIAAVVGVLAGAFVYLWKTNEDFRKRMTGIWKEIGGVVSGFVNDIKRRMPEIKTAFTNIVNAVKPIWDAFSKMLAPVFEGGMQQILNIVKTVTSILTGMMDVYTGLFTGNGQKIMQGLNTIYSSIFTFIINTLQSWWTAINGVLGIIGGAIVGKISGPFNSAKAKVSETASGIVSSVKNKFNKLKTIIPNAIDAARTKANASLNSLKNSFKSKFNSVVNIVKGAVGKIKSVFNFKWKLPMLKVPKVNMDGGAAPWGIGGKGRLPSFNVTWYKKAYDEAYLLKNPTIFGAAGGNLLGGGEGSGSEVIVGVDKLAEIIAKSMSNAGQQNGQAAPAGNHVTLNIPKFADSIVVREDSDIDKIAAAIVHRLEIASADMVVPV